MEEKKFRLPDLPYGYGALEPYIDEATMRVHHDKHHAAYTEKFNAVLEKHPELFEKSPEEILRDLAGAPDDVRLQIANQGGGFVNHSLFWKILAPSAEAGYAGGKLLEAIERDFGDFEPFRKQMTETAISHFGSGWAWLVKDKTGKLKVYSLSNQDAPYALGDTPILLFDLWEHAYYLKYQNRRAEYIENLWNVVNWNQAEENYLA